MTKKPPQPPCFLTGDLIFGLVTCAAALLCAFCKIISPGLAAYFFFCLAPLVLAAYLRSVSVVSQLIVSFNRRSARTAPVWSTSLSLILLVTPVIYLSTQFSILVPQVIAALSLSWLIISSITVIKNRKSPRPIPVSFRVVVIVALGAFCIFTPFMLDFANQNSRYPTQYLAEDLINIGISMLGLPTIIILSIIQYVKYRIKLENK